MLRPFRAAGATKYKLISKETHNLAEEYEISEAQESGVRKNVISN